MGKMSKTKGKVGEREVVNLYKERGYNARRGQQFKGTPDSPDVEVEEFPWLHHEVKRVETFNAYKALKQAEEDRSEAQVPVVYHRRNKEEWIVVLKACDFLNILNRYDHQP